MIDDIKDLAIKATMVAVLGGIISYLLGMVLGPISAINIVGPLIGGVLAIVLLFYIAIKTNLDKMSIFNIVVLLLFVSVIGTLIVSIAPIATGYILTLTQTLTWANIAWSFVYVGLAMMIYDKFM